MSEKKELDELFAPTRYKNRDDGAINDQRIDRLVEFCKEIKEKEEEKENFKVSKIRVDSDLYYPVASDIYQKTLTFEELRNWKERIIIEDWEQATERYLWHKPEIETQHIIPDAYYYELEFECDECGSMPFYDEQKDEYYCPQCEQES